MSCQRDYKYVDVQYSLHGVPVALLFIPPTSHTVVCGRHRPAHKLGTARLSTWILCSYILALMLSYLYSCQVHMFPPYIA